MKTIDQQIADKCIHFNGLMSKECNAGVKYEDVKVPAAKPVQVPCMKNTPFSGGSCIKCQFPTAEEMEVFKKEVLEAGENNLKAYSAIVAHITKTKELKGKMKCPVCEKEDLQYIQSSSNKHIWADCKCGISFRE